MDLSREVVEFRDGTKLTVTEATWSISMKLQDLEAQAKETPLTDEDDQIFQLVVWPRLMACTSGAVPTFEEALAWPATELDKWYFAVKRVNPDWFIAVEEAQKKVDEEALLEKKELTPTTSLPD